ncbi:MAG: lipid-A-disaccharide synthase N-terminal domain-containing protein, partial [Solirubrobacterales bacterium]
DFWAAVGFAAQMVFASRFIVQWIVSERRGESVIPVSFWYLSLIGSGGLLLYAIVRADPVFILGQSMGSIIYVRNLTLIHRSQKTSAARQAVSSS